MDKLKLIIHHYESLSVNELMQTLTVPKGLMNCKEIQIEEVNACGRWDESYAVKKIIASLA